jgi:hypothetical protein
MPKTAVSITEKHLSEAKYCAPFECAMALAINDLLEVGFFSSVGPRDFFIFNFEAKRVFACLNNNEITEFIDKFEDGAAVPTTIILDIPVEFLK